jgi:hypothetical protein
MLEGQVAVLSSGLLTHRVGGPAGTPAESALSTERTTRYILYPNRQVPSFPGAQHFTRSGPRVAPRAALSAAGDRSIVNPRRHGDFHFAAHIRNAKTGSRTRRALRDPNSAGWSNGTARTPGCSRTCFVPRLDHRPLRIGSSLRGARHLLQAHGLQAAASPCRRRWNGRGGKARDARDDRRAPRRQRGLAGRPRVQQDAGLRRLPHRPLLPHPRRPRRPPARKDRPGRRSPHPHVSSAWVWTARWSPAAVAAAEEWTTAPATFAYREWAGRAVDRPARRFARLHVLPGPRWCTRAAANAVS